MAIRNELYQDALTRLRELQKMKVVYVSNGDRGSEKVANLLAFAQKSLPALISLMETWIDAPPTDPALEDARFQLAMDVLHKPMNSSVEHLLGSLAAIDD